MSDLSSLSRRDFLASFGAFAASQVILPSITTPVAASIMPLPLASDFYRPPMMSISSIVQARREETIFRDPEQWITHAPSLEALEHDPAGIFLAARPTSTASTTKFRHSIIRTL